LLACRVGLDGSLDIRIEALEFGVPLRLAAAIQRAADAAREFEFRHAFDHRVCSGGIDQQSPS
jgi:hypothetical protein